MATAGEVSIDLSFYRYVVDILEVYDENACVDIVDRGSVLQEVNEDLDRLIALFRRGLTDRQVDHSVLDVLDRFRLYIKAESVNFTGIARLFDPLTKGGEATAVE